MLLASCSQVLSPASLLMGHFPSERDQGLARIATYWQSVAYHLIGGRSNQGNGKLRHGTAYL
jgi:hypothetical protein